MYLIDCLCLFLVVAIEMFLRQFGVQELPAERKTNKSVLDSLGSQNLFDHLSFLSAVE